MEPANNHASNLLGPWEESITGEKAQDQLATQIADFLFQHVVSRRDHGELASRGVEIEIEAKLGQLINIETNDRLSLPVTSECVIASNYRLIGFKSAMTEVCLLLETAGNMLTATGSTPKVERIFEFEGIRSSFKES